MDELEVKPAEGTAPESIAEAVIPEAAPEAAAEAPKPKYSDSFRERIKLAYPDEEIADDEMFYQKASEQIDNLEMYRNKNMEANKALMEIFDAEPAVAEVLKDMIKGASFQVALAKHFSPEDLVVPEGADDEEMYKTNLDARSKRLKDNEDWNKRKTENMDLSQKAVNEFVAETGLDPDKANEILSRIGEVIDEVVDGKVSKDFLMSMYRAFNYDNDLKTAEDTGRIAGKNEKIEVEKMDKKEIGDTLPVIASGGEQKPTQKKASWLDDTLMNEKKRTIL